MISRSVEWREPYTVDIAIYLSYGLCEVGIKDLNKRNRGSMSFRKHDTISICARRLVCVRVQFLFDLVSYCDIRIQSNPFIHERDKRVLVERVMVRILWGRSKIEWVQGW